MSIENDGEFAGRRAVGRQLISDAVSGGGFPPLLLDPVDFAALYRQRAGQMQPAAPKITT